MSVHGVPDGYTRGYTRFMKDQEPMKALGEATGLAIVLMLGMIGSIWFFWTRTPW